MNRKIIILSALLSSLSFERAFSQVTFQKIIGESFNMAWHIEKTNDQGYIISGSPFHLIKTNADGDILWTKIFGSGAGYATCVRQTNDGGYIASGNAYDIGAGDADAYVVKTDSLGNPQWSKTYGGIYNDDAVIVQQTFDGGYILLGSTASFGTGNTDFDVFLIKTDANGDTLWTRRFGGTESDEGLSVQQTADSGYIITGGTQSFGAGQDDVYLLKTDNHGDLLWSKTFGGPEADLAWSVKQTSDGGYIMAGTSHSSGFNNFGDVYLIKTNSYGDTLWTKAFGGVAGTDQSYCVQQVNDGGFVVFGETYSFGGHSDMYLVKTESDGNMLWSKAYGGDLFDHGYFIQQANEGGYVMVGSTNTFGDGGHYFIKTDGNGNSGCNESDPPSIQMSTTTQVSIPATVTSSGCVVMNQAEIVSSGFTINTLCTSVGIDEIVSSISFLISPNPSPGAFVVTSCFINEGTIEIYNVVGSVVFKKNIYHTSTLEISLGNISGGVYVARIYDGEKMYSRKLIIQHN